MMPEISPYHKHQIPRTGDAATMPLPDLEPLAEMPMHPHIAALPKADIHIHQEWSPRLDKVLARREGRAPYNWRKWAASLMQTVPPGAARLRHLSSHFPAPLEADAQPHNFVARVVHMLEEAAADGALACPSPWTS